MASKVQVTFDFKANLGNVKSQMNQLQQMVNQVNKSSHINFGMDTNTFATFKTNLNELSMHMKKAFDPNTGSMNFAALNKSISQSGKTLGQYGRELIQTGRMGEQAFTQMASAIMSSNAPMMKTSATLTKLWGTFKNTLRWQVSSSVLMGFTSTLQQGVQYAKDLNRSLNDIQVVTGKTNEQMKKVEQTASRMAKELKSSTLEIAKAQLIYYQQGDAAALASKKAEITTKAAAIAFNSSAQQMSEYLTAIWNSYQVGESQLESFVDKLAAIGATTATSMEEIATAMQKVAATANSVGVTFDQLNATIATISSATRVGAEQVGTALKTIYARIGDLKIGKDEDGMGLGQVSSQLNAMGIKILDAQNNLRDMGTIVEEIGNKWQTWTDAQQAAVAQAVAGKRQYTQLFALFDNWEDYQMSLLTSQTATGTLDTQFETWGTSWEAASNRVKQSAETIYSSLFEDDAFIDMTNILADFLNGIGNVVKGLGGMGGTLSALGAVFMTIFQGQIHGTLTNFFTNIGLAKQSLVDLAIVGARRAANGLKDSQSAIDSTNTKVGIFTKTVNALSNALSKIGSKKTSLETTLSGISDALKGQDLRTEEGRTLARNVAIQRAKTKAESSGPMSPMRQEMLDQQVAEAQEKSDALYDARVRYKEASNLHFKEQSLVGDAARSSFEELKKNPLNDKAQSQYREDRTRELRASMGFGENAADQKNFRRTLKNRSEDLQNSIIAETQNGTPDVKKLQKLKKEFESVQGTLNQYDEANRQANNEVNKLAKGYEEVSKASKDYSSALGKIGKFDSNSMKDVASGLASVTQGFSSAAMGASMLINGVKGLFQVINDDSMSAADRLGAVLSSLASIGMALPMVSSGWKVMTQGMKTLNNVKIGGGAAKVAEQVADKTEDTKENVVETQQLNKLAEIEGTIASGDNNIVAAIKSQKDGGNGNDDSDSNLPDSDSDPDNSPEGQKPTQGKGKKKKKGKKGSGKGKGKKGSGKGKGGTGKGAAKAGGNAAKGAGKAAGAATETGGAASGASGAASGAGAGISAAGILAIVAIAIAGAVAAWKLVDYAQKESERSAQKAAEALKMQQEAYNQAKSAYDEFTASADKLDEINKRMKDMTAGTEEFTNAVLEANEQVLSLVSKNPELAEYITYMEDGRMALSEEGLEQAKKQQQESLKLQQAATMNATITSSNANIDAQAEKLGKDVSKADETTKIAGGLGTAGLAVGGGIAGGALAGAAAGSVVPVVGNIIGAVVGALVGVVATVAANAATDPSDDFDALVEEIQKNGMGVMEDRAKLERLTGKTGKELEAIMPQLRELANNVHANTVATDKLTKQMILSQNDAIFESHDLSETEQIAIAEETKKKASDAAVESLVNSKFTNHGLNGVFSGGNNDKAINEAWIAMKKEQAKNDGSGITDFRVTEGTGDEVLIEYLQDGKWIKEEGKRSQKQMAEEAARWELTKLTPEDIAKFRKKQTDLLTKAGLDSSTTRNKDFVAQILANQEITSLSNFTEEEVNNIKNHMMNLSSLTETQKDNLQKALNNYKFDVQNATVSAAASFAEAGAKLKESIDGILNAVQEFREADGMLSTSGVEAFKKLMVDAEIDQGTQDAYITKLWAAQGDKSAVSKVMGDIIKITSEATTKKGKFTNGSEVDENSQINIAAAINQLTATYKSMGIGNAEAAAKSAVIQRTLEQLVKNNADEKEIIRFLESQGYSKDSYDLDKAKLAAWQSGIQTGTIKLEDLNHKVDAIVGTFGKADSALSGFRFALMGLNSILSNFTVDNWGNITGVKDGIDEMLYLTDKDGNAHFVTEEEAQKAVRKAYGDENYTTANWFHDYAAIINEKRGGGVSGGIINTDMAIPLANLALLQNEANELSESINKIGSDPKALEEYNKERTKKLKNIAEKEEDFAKDMAEAWEEEYSESLKETLDKTFNYLERYQKKVEGLDFGIDLIGEFDHELKGTLLQNKLTTLTQYGLTMKQEFNELANTIPQTAEAAQEVASRIEELGGNMRSNITDIRETQVEIQKLKIASISEWASNRGEALNKELAALEKRIDLLTKDSFSNNFKYTNQILRFSLLTLDKEGNKYEKQLKDKQKVDKEIITEEQKTQEIINAIVSKAIDMQNAENAKKRQEEREKLIEDYEETMADLKEELAKFDEDFHNRTLSIQNDLENVRKKIADITAEIAEANKNNMLYIGTKFVDGSIETLGAGDKKSLKQDLTAERVTNLSDGDSDTRNDYFKGYNNKEIASARNTFEEGSEEFKLLNKALDERQDRFREAISKTELENLSFTNSSAEIKVGKNKKANPKKLELADRKESDYVSWEELAAHLQGNGFSYSFVKELYGSVVENALVEKGAVWDPDAKKTVDAKGKGWYVAVASIEKLENYLQGDGKWSAYYAEGTSYHPGGLAVVGDEKKGAYEIAVLPDGTIKVLGKDKAELVDLPKGTVVIPHDESKEILNKTGDIDGQKVPKYQNGAGVQALLQSEQQQEVSFNIPMLENPFASEEILKDTEEQNEEITKNYTDTNLAIQENTEARNKQIAKDNKKTTKEVHKNNQELTSKLDIENNLQVTNFDLRGDKMITENQKDMQKVYDDTKLKIGETQDYATQNPIIIPVYYKQMNQPPSGGDMTGDPYDALSQYATFYEGKTNDFGVAELQTDNSFNFSAGRGKTFTKGDALGGDGEWCGDYVSRLIMDAEGASGKKAYYGNKDNEFNSWYAGVSSFVNFVGGKDKLSTNTKEIEKGTLLFKYEGKDQHVGIVLDVDKNLWGKIENITYADGNAGGIPDNNKSLAKKRTKSLEEFKGQWHYWSQDPIKFYATGTKGHPGGPAVVGDEFKGAYEAVISPNGKMSVLGKDNAMMMDLPEGTQVIPHDETKKILDSGMKVPMYAEGTSIITNALVDALVAATGTDYNMVRSYLTTLENNGSQLLTDLGDWTTNKNGAWYAIVDHLNPTAAPQNPTASPEKPIELTDDEAKQFNNGTSINDILSQRENQIEPEDNNLKDITDAINDNTDATNDNSDTTEDNTDAIGDSNQKETEDAEKAKEPVKPVKTATTPYDYRYFQDTFSLSTTPEDGYITALKDLATQILNLIGYADNEINLEQLANYGINSEELIYKINPETGEYELDADGNRILNATNDILNNLLWKFDTAGGFNEQFWWDFENATFKIDGMRKILSLAEKIEQHTSLLDVDDMYADAATRSLKSQKGFSNFVGLSDANIIDTYYVLNDLLYAVSLMPKYMSMTDADNKLIPNFFSEATVNWLASQEQEEGKSDPKEGAWYLQQIINLGKALGLDLNSIFEKGYAEGLSAIQSSKAQVDAVVDNTYGEKYPNQVLVEKVRNEDWLQLITNLTARGEKVQKDKSKREAEAWSKIANISNTFEEQILATDEYTRELLSRKLDEEYLVARELEMRYAEYLTAIEIDPSLVNQDVINAFETAIEESAERMTEYNEKIAEAIKAVVDYYNELIDNTNKIQELNSKMIDHRLNNNAERANTDISYIGQLMSENIKLQEQNMETAETLTNYLRETGSDEDSPEILSARTAYLTAKDEKYNIKQQMLDFIKDAFEREKDNLITVLESEKEFSNISFEFNTNIDELRKDLNNQLQESLTNYSYLDKDTRELIFNEEDYTELTNALNDISKQFSDIEKEKKEALALAIAEGDYAQVEHITQQYQLQTELLMDQYELKKAELELVKKETELQNVLNERNVQMFINGRWQWVADTQKVAEAQKAYNDAKFEKEQQEKEKTHNEEINAKDQRIEEINYGWNKALQTLEGRIMNSTEYLGAFNEMLDDITNETFADLYDVLYGEGASDGIKKTKYNEHTLTGEVKKFSRSLYKAVETIFTNLGVLENEKTSETEKEIAKAQIQDAASKLALEGYAPLANILLTKKPENRKAFLESLKDMSYEETLNNGYFDTSVTTKEELDDWYKTLIPDKASPDAVAELAAKQITDNADANANKIVAAIKGTSDEDLKAIMNEILYSKGILAEAETEEHKNYIMNAEGDGKNSYRGLTYRYGELEELLKNRNYSEQDIADIMTFVRDNDFSTINALFDRVMDIIPISEISDNEDQLFNDIIYYKNHIDENNKEYVNKLMDESLSKLGATWLAQGSTTSDAMIKVDALKNLKTKEEITFGEGTMNTLNEQRDKLTNLLDTNKEGTDIDKKALDKIKDQVRELGILNDTATLDQLQGKATLTYISSIISLLESIKNKPSGTSTQETSKTTNTSSSSSSAKPDSSSSAKKESSLSPLPLSFVSRYPNSILSKFSHAATGTRSALHSLYQINEIGEETFVTPDGHFRNFAGGEVVFTHEQSQRLFSLLNADLFDTGKGIGNVGKFEQSNSNDTYINIGGISVDTTSQDGKDLVEILQRITNI